MRYTLEPNGQLRIADENDSSVNNQGLQVQNKTISINYIKLFSILGIIVILSGILIQCYYPDNACIDTICDKVVSNAGCESVIVLNSEASIILDQNHYLNADYFVLGASNRLHYDRYT